MNYSLYTARNCGFYWLGASLSSCCIRSAAFLRLHQICENQTWCYLKLQTCCKLIKQLTVNQACEYKNFDDQLALSMFIIKFSQILLFISTFSSPKLKARLLHVVRVTWHCCMKKMIEYFHALLFKLTNCSFCLASFALSDKSRALEEWRTIRAVFHLCPFHTHMH